MLKLSFKRTRTILKRHNDHVPVKVLLTIALLFQAGIGLTANNFLLFFQIFSLLQDQRPKPTDLITCHLALVHLVLLLIVIFLASPDLFESLYFQSDYSDFKWKAFFYMHRVMGSLSICTICLLSMRHAVAVSPGTSSFANSEQKFTGYIFHSFFFLWVLSLSLSSNLLPSTVASSFFFF
ncbi:putative vomeronasal receptor-like protein 4 [Papio anubis]|uniref:putative vomeronasal receptor-like protein 4 n=1 Tax=Papio anubis TaxID=9555 RepID=UPI0012AD8158|nr:putative vomeronasal receptor-like protein 4 [Papio anubis]